jgi:molybdopterin-guanine dinucleotide biosynthesis protein B
MKAISIVGCKKSGKTTLGLALTKKLTEKGFKVGVLKHSHHGFDGAEGTDTEEYKKTAVAVAAYSPEESFVSWKRERMVQDLIPLLDADILIMEGSSKEGWLPRFILADRSEDSDKFMPELAIEILPQLNREKGLDEKEIERLAELVCSRGFLLPGLNCKACGRQNCKDFAADIVAGKASAKGCKTTAGEMEVTCNGNPVALNPFVRDILSAGITAMLGQLKGYTPGELQITIKNTGK